VKEVGVKEVVEAVVVAVAARHLRRARALRLELGAEACDVALLRLQPHLHRRRQLLHPRVDAEERRRLGLGAAAAAAARARAAAGAAAAGGGRARRRPRRQRARRGGGGRLRRAAGGPA